MLQASFERGTGVSAPLTFGSWDNTAGVLDHPFANYLVRYSVKPTAQKATLKNIRSNLLMHVFHMVQVLLKMGFKIKRGIWYFFSSLFCECCTQWCHS